MVTTWEANSLLVRQRASIRSSAMGCLSLQDLAAHSEGYGVDCIGR